MREFSSVPTGTCCVFGDSKSTPIDHLDPSVWLYNCLENAGINGIGTLLDKILAELLTLRNFGNVIPGEVEEILRNLSLQLKESKPISARRKSAQGWANRLNSRWEEGRLGPNHGAPEQRPAPQFNSQLPFLSRPITSSTSSEHGGECRCRCTESLCLLPRLTLHCARTSLRPSKLHPEQDVLSDVCAPEAPRRSQLSSSSPPSFSYRITSGVSCDSDRPVVSNK